MIKSMENKAPEEILEAEHKVTDDSINDGLLEEGFLSAEFVEEIVSVLPPPPPPEVPKTKLKLPDILCRSRVKSESFILLMDPRRPGVYIDLAKSKYSQQILHEALSNHLLPEIQELIKFFVDKPFTAAVAEADWENPPKFKLQYTSVKNNPKTDKLNDIFAQKALNNPDFKFRALSTELQNLPKKLTEELEKSMDIADIEGLREQIENLIKTLLRAEKDSPEYKKTVKETKSLSRGIGEKVLKNTELVNRVEMDHDHEDLCMIVLDYPTWPAKKAWNYAAPWKVINRRKNEKFLKEMLEELEQLI